MEIRGIKVPDEALTREGAQLLLDGSDGEYVSDSGYEAMGREEVLDLLANPSIVGISFLATGEVMVDTDSGDRLTVCYEDEDEDGEAYPKRFTSAVQQYIILSELLGIRGIFDNLPWYCGMVPDSDEVVFAFWSHNPEDMATVFVRGNGTRPRESKVTMEQFAGWAAKTPAEPEE